MNSGQTIEVVIRKSGTPGMTQANPASAHAEASEPGKPSVTQKQVNTLLINYGKQTLQEGFKLYNDFSGDYILANKIASATNIAADIATIAIGGWVGAVAVGYKYSTQLIEQAINIQRINNEIEARKIMLGQVVQLGGRYTNG